MDANSLSKLDRVTVQFGNPLLHTSTPRQQFLYLDYRLLWQLLISGRQRTFQRRHRRGDLLFDSLALCSKVLARKRLRLKCEIARRRCQGKMQLRRSSAEQICRLQVESRMFTSFGENLVRRSKRRGRTHG